MVKKQAVEACPEVRTFKVTEIHEAAYNPRVISETALEGLAYSMQRFGCVEPIIVNVRDGRNILVGGHQRMKVLRAEKVQSVLCVVVDLNDDDERLLNLSLNNPEIQGAFIEKLDAYIAAMAQSADEEDMLGLRINALRGEIETGTQGLTDEDDVPEPPKVAKTKLGDLYLLGEHRLLCGDSTKAEDVERLMDGQKAEMVFTSPPYWVGFSYENEKEKDTILDHIKKSSENIASYTKGRVVINTANISSITFAQKITGKKQPALLVDWWIDAMNRNNYLLRHIRIWAKTGGIQPSRKNDKIDMNWEYLALFTEEDGNAGFIATFRQAENNSGIVTETPPWAVTGVWTDIVGKARGSGHVAAFPVELVLRYLRMYSVNGNLMFEPYCGSGTTLIACEKTGRRCYGMELDPIYCDVIVKRWEAFTGKKAERLAAGAVKKRATRGKK